MAPKVSVIVPNYNHENFLKQRLDSILNQTYQNFELIILDDASSDNSQTIINQYKEDSRVTHCETNAKNSGSPFQQWQKGIELAKGEFIWIAESDDFCEPTFLENVLSKLSSKVGICYVQSIDVNSEGAAIENRINYTENFEPNIWKTDFSMSGTDFIKKYLLVKNVIPNASAVVFRRDLIDFSMFSQEFLDMRMCGDWLFWIKLCERTNLSFVHLSLNFFRHHEGVSRNHSSSNKRKRRIIEEIKVRNYLEKNIGVRFLSREKKLMGKWLKLHSPLSIFDPQFYKGKMASVSFMSFISQLVKKP